MSTTFFFCLKLQMRLWKSSRKGLWFLKENKFRTDNSSHFTPISNSLEEEKAITLIWIWHYNHDLFGNQHVIFFLPPLKSFSNPAPKQQQTNQLKIHTIQFNSNKLLIRVLAWKVAIQYFLRRSPPAATPSSAETTSFAYFLLAQNVRGELIP